MRFYFILLLLSIGAAGFAQKTVPELWGLRVHDEAHVLSKPTVDLLENQLRLFEDSTSNQLAILIISSLDGEVLRQISVIINMTQE